MNCQGEEHPMLSHFVICLKDKVLRSYVSKNFCENSCNEKSIKSDSLRTNDTPKQTVTEEPFDAVQAVKEVRGARAEKLMRMLDEE